MVWSAKTKSFGVLSVQIVAMKMLRLPVQNTAAHVKVTLSIQWLCILPIQNNIKMKNYVIQISICQILIPEDAVTTSTEPTTGK